jgi:hypothetical protein
MGSRKKFTRKEVLATARELLDQLTHYEDEDQLKWVYRKVGCQKSDCGKPYLAVLIAMFVFHLDKFES